MQERRQYLRININNFVWSAKYAVPGGKTKGKSKNISAGGILIESMEEYQIGDMLKMDIELPGWHKFNPAFDIFGEKHSTPLLHLTAKVARVDKTTKGLFNIGIRFTGIKDSDKKALETYCKKRSWNL